jgi:predicted DNA-binding transcriptional regulator YafY
MQIIRLFKIVYILLDKKITTARELAELFEVSSRTIYRDIDALSSAGIPIMQAREKVEESRCWMILCSINHYF